MHTKLREQVIYKDMILLVSSIVNYWTLLCLFKVIQLTCVIHYGSYQTFLFSKTNLKHYN